MSVMKPLSPTVTTQKLAELGGVRWRHTPKETRRAMVEFVMSKQSDDKRVLEEAFRVCKERKGL